MRIAKEGIPFILAFLALAVLPGAMVRFAFGAAPAACAGAAAPGALLALFSIWFFRDPERTPPDLPGVVVSPADGKVVAVRCDEKGAFLAIFLNVFDVHVNRSPIAGRVEKVSYREGRFLAAFDERAGEANERNDVVVVGEQGTVRVSQIAGLIARRIVCRVGPGDTLAAGERFGMIRFGSRTDLLLPAGSTLSVRVGQRVKGGETAVGLMPVTAADRRRSQANPEDRRQAQASGSMMGGAS
jgi:phosphatidylserine decarboxylase